jgi:uncharacterized protein (DUF433 family)
MCPISTTTSMIVETSRGPRIAGRRTTVYAIMDFLKSGVSRDVIKEAFLISDEQLEAVLTYIAAHKAEVEKDYAEIVQRSKERREFYEQIYRARTRLDPQLSQEEKAALLRQKLARKQKATQPGDGHHYPPRS